MQLLLLRYGLFGLVEVIRMEVSFFSIFCHFKTIRMILA